MPEPGACPTWITPAPSATVGGDRVEPRRSRRAGRGVQRDRHPTNARHGTTTTTATDHHGITTRITTTTDDHGHRPTATVTMTATGDARWRRAGRDSTASPVGRPRRPGSSDSSTIGPPLSRSPPTTVRRPSRRRIDGDTVDRRQPARPRGRRRADPSAPVASATAEVERRRRRSPAAAERSSSGRAKQRAGSERGATRRPRGSNASRQRREPNRRRPRSGRSCSSGRAAA